ncbi:hypothetical protein B0H63DRAFT_527885 [Podospora didyma]|uniref:Uncharacterized protein n=1 Tax=Podospora didyma TaxID=330526 RepID=A0AAE0N4R5_9PEZI|nr:hypothetical protein B0H63DRAFT_527885 [Podospora didyma]
MAPAALPSSFHRDHTPTGGFDHDHIATKPPLAPIRNVQRSASPPAVAPVHSARPPTAIAAVAIASPDPISALLPPPAPLGPLEPATHETNGSITRSRSRDATSSSRFMSDQDSAWSREEESISSSEDDVFPPPPDSFRPFSSAASALARSNFRPAQSWHFGPTSRLPQGQQAHQTPRPTTPESESAYSSEGQDLWFKVEEQRTVVRHVRDIMARKRTMARELRQKMAGVDNAFMQKMRPHLTKSMAVFPTEVVANGIREMQSIRDDYYSAESAYEAEEEHLEREESKLQALELDFVRLMFDWKDASHYDSTSATFVGNHRLDLAARVHAETKDAEDDDGDDSASRITLLGISGERHEDIHPLYQELLDAAAECELTREHYEELQMQHEDILHDVEMSLHRERGRNNQGNFLSEDDLRSLRLSLAHVPESAADFRAQFGVSISEDDLDFLQDFEAEEDRVRKKLEEASRNVEWLRAECTKKGVMRKNASYSEEFTIFLGSSRSSLLAEGNISIEPSPGAGGDLTHPKFPILLSNPSHVLELLSPSAALEKAMKLPKDNPLNAQRRADCMKELGITTLMKKVDGGIPDYINQWLIHRLRTSPLEAELMFTISEAEFKIVNLRRWQEEVLLYWRRDEAANLSPIEFQSPQTPKDQLSIVDDMESLVNSVIEASTRAKSEGGGPCHRRHSHHQYQKDFFHTRTALSCS